MSRTGTAVTAALALTVGVVSTVLWQRPAPLPPTATLVDQVREVARLETLEVSLHKKIIFAADPQAFDSAWQGVWQWVRESVRPSQGRVIVFANAHLAVDLSQLGPDKLVAHDGHAFVILPPVRATVEILPGETEVIDSTLDTAQTANLLETARLAFVKEVEASPRLMARARAGAERAIAGFLKNVGFRDVRFVTTLPTVSEAPS